MRPLHSHHLGQLRRAPRGLLPSRMESRRRPHDGHVRRPRFPPAGGHRRHERSGGASARPVSRAPVAAPEQCEGHRRLRRARRPIDEQRSGAGIGEHRAAPLRCPSSCSQAHEPMDSRCALCGRHRGGQRDRLAGSRRAQPAVGTNGGVEHACSRPQVRCGPALRKPERTRRGRVPCRRPARGNPECGGAAARPQGHLAHVGDGVPWQAAMW